MIESFPNKNRIAKILGISNFDRAQIKQCKGFSKKVYKLIYTKKTTKISVAIKKSSLGDFLFHKKIEKIDLNSFKLCGKYKEDDNIWIITEWVESKNKNQDVYNLMIDWLIKKDKRFFNKHHLVKRIFNDGNGWWKMIENNKKSKILAPDIYKKILNLKNEWSKINLILSDNHQTICHNDFEPKNTLLSKNNKFYIFDWSNPCIGSIFIDLARLINTAPLYLRKTIIDKYKKNFMIRDFDYLLKIAQKRDHLSVFAALCNHINNGYEKEVNMKKFIRYADILCNY